MTDHPDGDALATLFLDLVAEATDSPLLVGIELIESTFHCHLVPLDAGDPAADLARLATPPEWRWVGIVLPPSATSGTAERHGSPRGRR